MNNPLNPHKLNELLRLKDDGFVYHRESQELEFKEQYNFAGLADYFKDFAAFSNNKGGYLIFGVKDKPKRELVGLTSSSLDQFDKIDPEKITGFLLNIFSSDIDWSQTIHEIDGKSFGIFYIKESQQKPVIAKKDEGRDQIIKNGEIYYRYGGRTQKIRYPELENIIAKRIATNNKQWHDLMSKISQIGADNAAVLNIDEGIIEKGESKILVVDEKLVEDLQWIKEGDFSEKKGERTLKLVGEVHPANQIEIIKKVQTNQLKDYPLSATKLCKEVRKINFKIGQRQIWDIIRDNDLKNNKDYSSYRFRNNDQLKNYEENGVVPNGIVSIYKESAIDFILNIFQNETEHSKKI